MVRYLKSLESLKSFAGSFFGDVAIPLEYMFAAPYLAAGDIEGAKKSNYRWSVWIW